MQALLHARNRHTRRIQEAQQERREVEDEVIIQLLRDNEHRFLSVAWRKLEREVFPNAK